MTPSKEHERLASDYRYCVQLLKDNCGAEYLQVKREIENDIDRFNMRTPGECTRLFIAEVWKLYGNK